jgi:hypothetical protein
MKSLILRLAAAMSLVSWPAHAHHSAAMFDSDKLVVLRGAVISFSYLNPHAWISVMTRRDNPGETVRWDVEATSPTSLRRLGIEKDTLKPGEKVTVGVRPLRDGRTAGALVFFVLANGKRYGADPSGLGLDIAKLKP